MEAKATTKIEAAVFAIQSANQKIKLLENQRRENLEKVKKFMDEKAADTLLNEKGDAVIGTYSERGGRPRLDAEKLKQECPAIYQKYLVETDTYKIFQVK